MGTHEVHQDSNKYQPIQLITRIMVILKIKKIHNTKNEHIFRSFFVVWNQRHVHITCQYLHVHVCNTLFL